MHFIVVFEQRATTFDPLKQQTTWLEKSPLVKPTADSMFDDPHYAAHCGCSMNA